MMAYLNTEYQELTLEWLAQRNFPLEMLSAVLDEDTGKLMEYRYFMKNKNTVTYNPTNIPRIFGY